MKTAQELPTIGDVCRALYGGPSNLRTIQVTKVYPNGVRAEVIKGSDGVQPKKLRFTTVTFKTLRGGYQKEMV